tara:strand:- start:1446 stop:1988 length:543 start_codon:yes stop_codon:yes gene_type:complete
LKYTDIFNFFAVYPEDCNCYGFRFEPSQKDFQRSNISYFLASEIPECAVVRVSETLPEGEYQVVLEYSLKKDTDRYLTPGGKVALRSLYDSIPVHSSINIDKFFSRHALKYCDTFANESTKVLSCVDNPYFSLSVSTRQNTDALTATEYFLLKYGISIVFCILLLAAPYVASAYKHSHVQ